ncbi:DUF1643 domain-containing protein [Streptomyces sp. NPDC059944]|uniref:DUF1643 domain-containing protein n=1 Tax=unclassified Streptomyces TaxID=2593676 RepID=UPI003644A72F
MTRPLPATPELRRSAVLSDCTGYRYLLTREWRDTGPTATFILLNPSTADSRSDDSTTRRCIAYAQNWGCGALLIANLYAWRATRPRDLFTPDDPVGPHNDAYIRTAAAVAEYTGGSLVAGWGTLGQTDRVHAVLALPGMHRLTALAVTRDGHPHHPLRLRDGINPAPWPGRPSAAARAEAQQYAVVLSRPVLGDIRIGPYNSTGDAVRISAGLRSQRQSTQHVPGTTVTVQPYQPELPHSEPWVPTRPVHPRRADGRRTRRRRNRS